MMLLGRSIPWFGAGASRCVGSSRVKSRVAKACVAGLAACLLYAPKTASADILGDRADFGGSYGRMGIGWVKSGQVGAGLYMDIVSHNAIGGRLEEGDYLEPWMRLHLLKKSDDPDALQVDIQSSFEAYSTGAGLLGDIANGDTASIKLFPEQAYIEAKNVFTPGLSFWLGSRLYRQNDIHIADYFYFNKNVGNGAGVKYDAKKAGEVEFVVMQTTSGSSFFKYDLNTTPGASSNFVYRPRTEFIVQYKLPLGFGTSFVQAMAQYHVLPRSQNENLASPTNVNPPDWGVVGGLKLHMDLTGENFSDTSIRVGNRIANGAEGGGQTYQTFGVENADGTYKGAYGIEFVEHFNAQIKDIVGINGYFTAHYSHGATDLQPSLGPGNGTGSRDPSTCSESSCANARGDYAVGVRPIFYVADQFHIITEATYSMRKDDQQKAGTLVKLNIAPTIVPLGGKSVWSRPHIRLIYTVGFYNKAAQDQLMSSYLQTAGKTDVAHYLGARTEWWF